MAPHGGGGVHRPHDLDPLQLDELEVLVVEPLVDDELLQEGNELDGVVFVRLREVDVLEVQDQLLARLGAQHSAGHGGHRLPTDLRELLHRVLRIGLRGAVHDGDLGGWEALEQVLEEGGFAAPLGSDEQERLVVVQPRLQQRDVLLHAARHYKVHVVTRGRGDGLLPKHRRDLQQIALASDAGDLLEELLPGLRVQVGAEAAGQAAAEVPLRGGGLEVRDGRVHPPHLRGVDRRAAGHAPVKRAVEVVLHPLVHTGAQGLVERGHPAVENEIHIHVLLREEDHAAARDRGRRGEGEVLTLEEKVHVGAKLDALATGQSEQTVVVEHGVEGLDPFGIHVTIADDPAVRGGRLLDNLPRRRCEHAVKPLAGVGVHVPEELLARDGLGVHDVHHGRALERIPVRVADPFVRALEDAPQHGLARARGPDDDDADALCACHVQLQHLLHLQRHVREPHLFHHLLDCVLDLRVCKVRHVDVGEDVAHEVVEAARVVEGELGVGGHAQGADDELHLRRGGEHHSLGDGAVQEVPRDTQHRFERAQAPVVVLLRRKELLGEVEHAHQLAPRVPRGSEALRKQQHLSNELVVGHGHGHGTEERLEVIGELAAAAIALARGVEGHENAGVEVHIHLLAHKLHLRLALLERPLDELDLRGDRGEDVLLQAVEFVEAPPRAHLHEAHEDPAHRLEVELLVAIEDQHLPPQALPERLDTLRLPRARGAVGVASVPEVHALGEGEVALVREGRVHQLGGVALVLERVLKVPLRHAHRRLPALERVVAQLLGPHPVARG
mmetsp:Transcript_17017/g.54249  ORF Transcript_17017/g.54249 Transcript_17017/m.54249 type:complete len:785 (-) Transcript_17017:5142-7496(-)